jgi:3-isopropylmalate/(R)-2-methylmalate dehydratase small subunit
MTARLRSPDSDRNPASVGGGGAGARPPITRFEGRAVALPLDNVDTDQIIPARFLKTTSRSGLGEHLFANWRYDASGAPAPGFILNQAAALGAAVLVAGQNFGCGSSREHAPWALADFGFRAIVAASFADIFRQNALKNGLLPIALPGRIHAAVLDRVRNHPGSRIAVDLVRQTVEVPEGQVPFTIDPFARQCLLQGVDEIGYVLAQQPAIAAFESRR